MSAARKPHVTASADSPAELHPEPSARLARGRAARAQTPLEAHAALPTPANRPDPVAVLQKQAMSRLADLIPIRNGRMLVSPLAFYRGSAAVMAADLAGSPVSGMDCQLCGDAHLSNFGAFASPERSLVFDINDFDETHPGPWEWDVKRLAASLAVTGRCNGFSRKQRAAVVLTAVSRYRTAMRDFADMRDLDVWYAYADLDEVSQLLKNKASKKRRKKFADAQVKARTRDSLQAFRKMTAVVDGHRRILAYPPLIVPIQDLLPDTDRAQLESRIRLLVAGYADTLPVDKRHLLRGFRFVDMARKVVGVGSVGTRCWVVLLSGRDQDDPLLLQVKEAQPSVLAEYVPGRPANSGEGERVVGGQRLIQAASDIFLGWGRVSGIDGQDRDFYVRQLRDWKASAVVETMDPTTLRLYGALCGWTLARAHARTGDRIAIAGYLGDDAAFDQALLEFSERYADRNENDFQSLQAAAKAGRIPVHSGV